MRDVVMILASCFLARRRGLQACDEEGHGMSSDDCHQRKTRNTAGREDQQRICSHPTVGTECGNRMEPLRETGELGCLL